MNHAKDVLRTILPTTQRILDEVTRYVTARGIRQVGQHSLVRFESNLQFIIDASRAIFSVLDDPSLRHHYMLDDRLVNWLSGPEPEMCRDTLRDMERLLNSDHEVQAFSGFTSTGSGNGEDKIHAAVVLFDAHTTHFHFLLTTTIWNYQNGVVDKQSMSSNSGEVQVKSKNSPQNTAMAEHEKRKTLSQKLDKLMGALMPIDCSEKHRRTSTTRQSGTCAWLLDTNPYLLWKEGADTFLWLQGKAGCGKTVLASTVINDLQNTKKNGEFIAYFYCDFRSSRSRSAVDIMCSLLAQLTTDLYATLTNPEPLLDELLKAADSCVTPFDNPKGISRYISKIARLCSVKPFIVVDGLDECLQIESLLDGLIMCCVDARVLATTRPLQNIVRMLLRFPCLSIETMANELSADIRLHVAQELDSRPRLRFFSEEVRGEIQSMLCTKADGMFRWVQCQIDTLDKCSSLSEVRDALDSIPIGLEETYRRILFSIDGCRPEAHLVHRALVWLVAASRPLRLRELLEAVTIDTVRRTLDPGFTMMKDIDFLEASKSLVIHHVETDIVTLAHMSVREYLLGELVLAKLPRYHVVLEEAHERLARLCMAYIMFCLGEMKDCQDRSPGPTKLEQDLVLTLSDTSRPFLKYVLSDGFSHFMHLESGNARILQDMETLQGLILRHSWEWDRLCKLVPLVRSGIPWPTSKHDFKTYTLIAFSSVSLYRTYLDNFDFTRAEGKNPLVYAARFGKTDHAKVLITQGADVNNWGLLVDPLPFVDFDADGVDGIESIGDPSDDQKAIPLEVAVHHWHTGVLDLLLGHKCTIPDWFLNCVLQLRPHHYPLYIIRRLLQTVEFVKWAAIHWDNRRLLEAIVEDEGDYEQTVDRSDDDMALIVRRLVQVGCGEAFLLVAVENGCVPVIETLLSTTPPGQLHDLMNAIATNGDTPLHLAMRFPIENRSLALTKLLVEARCDPRGLDADDKPPFQLAVIRGYISVVEYLLSLNVPLPSRVLLAALQSPVVKRVKMIRLLASKGANVHATSPEGDSLLHAAICSPDRSLCLEIVESLISFGCNPAVRNASGITPLYVAARQRHLELVNYLVSFSSPLDVLALLQDRETHASIVLSHMYNPDVSCFRFQGWQALQIFHHLVLAKNEEDYLELASTLVESLERISPDTRNVISSNFIYTAVQQGYDKVVEFLASNAVSLPPKILFTAIGQQPQMVSLLVRKGANIHAENDGETLLHAVMRKLKEEQCSTITQMLVESSYDAFACNTYKRPPIYIAVARNFISVTEYLLSHYSSAHMSLPEDLLFAAIRPWETPANLSMIKLLVDHGADVNRSTSKADQATHSLLRRSASFAKPDCTQTPVELGRDLSEPNANGDTPIQLAVAGGLISVTEYLLSKGASLPSDILLLALDSESCHPEMVSFLVHKGADVLARDKFRNTVLHHAVRPELLEIIPLLVNAGCDPNVSNDEGWTPCQLALNGRRIGIARYLLQFSSRRIASVTAHPSPGPSSQQDGSPAMQLWPALPPPKRALSPIDDADERRVNIRLSEDARE